MTPQDLLYKACTWHSRTLKMLEAMQGSELKITVEGQDGIRLDIEFTEEMRKGFITALVLIENHILTFPVRYGGEGQESGE